MTTSSPLACANGCEGVTLAAVDSDAGADDNADAAVEDSDVMDARDSCIPGGDDRERRNESDCVPFCRLTFGRCALT